MKIIKRFILFLGAAFLGLLVLSSIIFLAVRDLRIKDIVENEIEQSLGIEVTINKIDFSPLLAHVEASGITIHNPAGFAEGELAYVESIHFVCDPLEILTQKKPNIYLFSLNLERLNIIKNKDGKVNIKEIIPIKDENSSRETKASLYFDVVVLSVGEVNFIDYSSGSKKERKYHIGLKDATFVGLKDGDVVVKAVVSKAIENTDIGKLINLSIVPIVSQLGNTVDSAWGTAKTGAKGIWEVTTMPFKLLVGKN